MPAELGAARGKGELQRAVVGHGRRRGGHRDVREAGHVRERGAPLARREHTAQVLVRREPLVEIRELGEEDALPAYTLEHVAHGDRAGLAVGLAQRDDGGRLENVPHVRVHGAVVEHGDDGVHGVAIAVLDEADELLERRAAHARRAIGGQLVDDGVEARQNIS